MRVKLSSLYIFFFSAVIFLFPINFGQIQLFNEPIFVLSFFGSAGYLILDNLELEKRELEILSIGFFFTVFFIAIFIIYFPQRVVIKDFVEPFKPFIYSVITVCGYRLSKYIKRKQLINYVIYASVFSIIISAFVFLPILHPIIDLFKGRMSTDSHALQFYRFSGTLGYPSPFGYWLVFSSLIVLFSFYKKLISFRFFFLLYGIIVAGMFLTGSRGAIVVYLLTTPFFFILTLNYKKTWYGISLIVILFLPGLIYIGYIFSDLGAVTYITEGFSFQNGIESLRNTSFGQRIEELEILGNELLSGRILGNGPANSYIQEAIGPVETVYFLYGFKFGVIGLGFYFLIFLSQVVVLFDELLRKRLTLPFIFAVWSVVILSIGALNESMTEEYKSFYLYFLLYGIFLGYYLNGKEITAKQYQQGDGETILE